jgi:hypothetical protein
MMTASLVIPAKAGIQLLFSSADKGSWIPAFAGMTGEGSA